MGTWIQGLSGRQLSPMPGHPPQRIQRTSTRGQKSTSECLRDDLGLALGSPTSLEGPLVEILSQYDQTWGPPGSGGTCNPYAYNGVSQRCAVLSQAFPITPNGAEWRPKAAPHELKGV